MNFPSRAAFRTGNLKDVFKSKRDALVAFLDKGMTMIHLDARREGVIVPDRFIGQQDLRLNLSYRFGLQLEAQHVEATLTFSGVSFRVKVPFSAIYALTSHTSGAGLVFPESLPEDILAALEREIDSEESVQMAPAAMPVAARAVSADGGSPQDLGRPTKAPFLRVIQGEKK